MQLPSGQRRPAPPGAVSVSELTIALKGHVENRFFDVHVYGEVFSARHASSGHLYLDLKDGRARIPCVVWRSTLQREALAIRDGMQLLVQGSVEIYPPHGKYQLVARKVTDIGLGDLLARLEVLKRELHAEGLFDAARKRPLPILPRRVGVVTAATGAAVRDILTTIFARYPANVLIAPCRVQGEGAAMDIARSIALLARVPEVDVIIVGRGGGSLQDLWAFNEEWVVRAIARCPVPVISAVGHEIDQPLSDLAADLRAPTPTAAGERVVPVMQDLRYTLTHRAEGLSRALERAIAGPQQTVDDATLRMARALRVKLEAARARLASAHARLMALHPAQRVSRAVDGLETLTHRLIAAMGRATRERAQHLEGCRRALTVLSPTASLDRGYAIVRRPDGAVLRSADDIDTGAPITVILHRGALQATVDARTARHEYQVEMEDP